MNRRVLAIALALMLIVGIAGYPVTALAEDERSGTRLASQ